MHIPKAAAKSVDGKIVFDSDRANDNEIFTVNSDGSDLKQLTNTPGKFNYGAAWSPDGKKITFYSNSEGNNDIYTVNADGSNRTNISHNPADDRLPIWSADGSKIFFVSMRDGDYEIYSMNSDGSNVARITNIPGTDIPAQSSPDGSKLLIVSARGGNFDIYTINKDGSGEVNLTNTPDFEFSPAYSSDGKRISYALSVNGQTQLMVMNADGSDKKNIGISGSNMSWSADSTRLVDDQVLSASSYQIRTMNADGTDIKNVLNDGHKDHISSSQAWQHVDVGETQTAPDNRIVTVIAPTDDFSTINYQVDANESLVVDGKICNATVTSGGVLKGHGTLCKLTVQSGGTVAPGNSPGCLTAGDTILSGTFNVDVGGTTPCTDYDQLIVNGTVTVGGSLNIQRYNNYKPAVGQMFTIISNDGTDAVTGTFSQGNSVSADGYTYAIDYAGGSNDNDVVLKVTAVPANAIAPGAPATGVAFLQASPAATFITFSLAAGAVVALARKSKKVS